MGVAGIHEWGSHMEDDVSKSIENRAKRFNLAIHSLLNSWQRRFPSLLCLDKQNKGSVRKNANFMVFFQIIADW
jgi:hypothetical protein